MLIQKFEWTVGPTYDRAGNLLDLYGQTAFDRAELHVDPEPPPGGVHLRLGQPPAQWSGGRLEDHELVIQGIDSLVERWSATPHTLNRLVRHNRRYLTPPEVMAFDVLRNARLRNRAEITAAFAKLGLGAYGSTSRVLVSLSDRGIFTTGPFNRRWAIYHRARWQPRASGRRLGRQPLDLNPEMWDGTKMRPVHPCFDGTAWQLVVRWMPWDQRPTHPDPDRDKDALEV